MAITENTKKRHSIVVDTVRNYQAKTIDGIKLDFESIIQKVSEETGYSPRFIKDILRDAEQGDLSD